MLIRRLRALRQRLRALWRRDAMDAELSRELSFHLEQLTREHMDAGLSPAEARMAARRALGNVPLLRDEARETWGWSWLEDAVRDTRLAARMLRRTPVFALTAIVTLALGIGASTTVFAVANAILFKPLPVSAPQALGRIKAGETQMAWANYEDLRRDSRVFTELAAFRNVRAALTTSGGAARWTGQHTSDNFFVALGVDAIAGRTYTPADTRRDLIVLAEHAWVSDFGGDASIVGRVVTLDGRPYEVVGIMSSGFRGVAPPGLAFDFWLAVDPALRPGTLSDRGNSEYDVVGRLRPDVTREQAEASLREIARQLKQRHPEIHDRFLQVQVLPVDGIRAFEGAARTLLPVFAFLTVTTLVSGFVLLVGCANIAGLLIGRAETRRHEVALRLALGAGPARLVRQLLTESAVLAAAGGAAGVLLAGWLSGGFNLIVASLPMRGTFDLQIDARVLLYAGVVTAAAVLLCGLLPARAASRFDVVSSLKGSATGSRVPLRLRRALVIGQVALSTALLVWSGLFVRSLLRIDAVHPGFNPDGVLVANVLLDVDAPERAERMLMDLHDRVERTAAVQSGGWARVVPLAMEGREEFDVGVPDAAGGAAVERVIANRVGPGWFRTVEIPLAAGRDFTWEDRQGAPRVVVVNETLARRFWNGDAVARRLFYGDGQAIEVIGVVKDSKYWTLGETVSPTVYLPLRQGLTEDATLHVRTSDPRLTASEIRQETAHIDPDATVEIRPMPEAVAVAVLPARIGAAATGAFGVLAILLSALGVYGLVAYAVVQRTREIGVRMVLGARAADVVRLIVNGSGRLALAGITGGLVLGALGGLALRAFIFGVSPLDPVTLIATAAIVIGTALAASAFPALAASRVDPATSLRNN